jgi:ADP-ribosyl-[dinitrogen reductase] hydrolase
MFVEAAIGDSYGAGFEYVSGADLIDRPNDLSGYYPHPRHNIGNGRYTDDTEMATAVAEAMLAGPLTRESLAQWFVQAFHREQRQGYAGRFFEFLKTVNNGTEFLAKIDPRSDKSGAAMRGWVIGLYGNLDLVMQMAELQAKITHDSPGGIASAQASALMTHYFLHQSGSRTGVADFVIAHVPGPWLQPRTTPVGSAGMGSVHAAIQAVMMHDRLSDILKQCIAFGGDVDTVATIAMGAASWAKDVIQDLPQALVGGLEDGQWGRGYLVSLDWRLNRWMVDRWPVDHPKV